MTATEGSSHLSFSWKLEFLRLLGPSELYWLQPCLVQQGKYDGLSGHHRQYTS